MNDFLEKIRQKSKEERKAIFWILVIFFLFPVSVFADQIQLSLVTASNYQEMIEQPYLVQWTSGFNSYHTFLKEFNAATALYQLLDNQLGFGIKLQAGVPGWLKLTDKFIILYERHN